MEEQLTNALRGLGEEWSTVEARNVEPLATGWENDNSVFDLSAGPSGDERLVLRVYGGEDSLPKARRETTGMGILHDLGYPVPQVRGLIEESWLGSPIALLEYVPGPTLGRVLSDASEEETAHLIDRFSRLLLELHRLPAKPFAPVMAHVAPAGSGVEQELGFWEAAYRQWPVAELRPALDWLHAHQPTSKSAYRRPVHWDFHPENVLVSDGRLVVVD